MKRKNLHVLVGVVLLISVCGCRRSLDDILAPLLSIPATERPRIIRSNPEPSNGLYDDTANLFVEFDRPMDATSTERAFSLSGSATPTGKTRWEGNRLVYDLSDPLTLGLPYVLRVSGSAKSSEGNTMETEYMVHFVTGSRIDAPTVLSSTPVPNAQGVDKTAQILLVFSRSMNRSSVEKSLHISPATYGSYAWSGGDSILTFTPYEGLTVPASYSVSLSTSATDAEGIALAASFSFSFQTGNDSTRPTVLELREEGAITPITEDPILGYYDGTYKDAGLVLTFSEPMQPTDTEGSVALTRNDDGSSVAVETYWAPTFDRLTVRPTTPLEPDTVFRLNLSTTAKDPSGNALLNPFQRRFYISNAKGAINSTHLQLVTATKSLPGLVQKIDKSPNFTTTLNIGGSDTPNTGAQATFEIDFSHSLDRGTVPGAITISKVLGVHPASGRIMAILPSSHDSLPDSRITLVIDQLGAKNEYRLRFNGTRSGIRSTTAPGETFTWMEDDLILNFRVEP